MSTSQEFLNIARTYGNEQKWNEMEENYIKAIKLENVEAMIELADFYSEEGFIDYSVIDHCRAQKYYKMAIEKGSVEAMRKLGYFYHYIDRNCEYNSDKIYQYYSMAIEKGDIESMYLMAQYYKWGQEYEKMEEYFLMAHEKGNKSALQALLNHYQNKVNEYVKNIEKYGEEYKKYIAKLSDITKMISVA